MLTPLQSVLKGHVSRGKLQPALSDHTNFATANRAARIRSIPVLRYPTYADDTRS
jgi:hypothetical protein